jgi:hypothetical protein
MYKYHRRLLPSSLNDLFNPPVHQIHSYNTRLSSNLCFSLPCRKLEQILDDYLTEIIYQGVITWNVLNETDKQIVTFLYKKKKIKGDFIDQY